MRLIRSYIGVVIVVLLAPLAVATKLLLIVTMLMVKLALKIGVDSKAKRDVAIIDFHRSLTR